MQISSAVLFISFVSFCDLNYYFGVQAPFQVIMLQIKGQQSCSDLLIELELLCVCMRI